jgi:hypothetical protein
MRGHRLHRWLTVGALLALPVLAHAQEAALSGTVTDTTGGALPGVTGAGGARRLREQL